MLYSEDIKSIALTLGADKCGISNINKFSGAPEGFKPTDVYSKCKSVVVLLKKMPTEVILAENPVIYSHTAHLLYTALDQIALNLCAYLAKHDIQGVPVPADVPYLFWDEDMKRGMGILSMRHAAFKAGLGILGRNTLLINREYGNMVYIGALLIDTEVEADPVVVDFSCPSNCTLCLDACPVKALDGVTVNQKLCRGFSSHQHATKGWDIYTCKQCRMVCPYRTGKK